MSQYLYFWRDRFVWWFQLLLGVAIIGLCFLLCWLIPGWGACGQGDSFLNSGVWDSLLIIPMIVLNMFFGIETDNSVSDWVWKISSFILTLIVAFYQPTTVIVSGIKMACTLVVMLTLIYAIFGHTLMQRLHIGGFLYDILFYACIVVALVVTAIFPTAVIGYVTDANSFLGGKIIIPYELALYAVCWLRFGPLHSIIERIVKGSDYDSGPSRSSSSRKPAGGCSSCKYCNLTTTGTYCMIDGEEVSTDEWFHGCNCYKAK